MESISQLGKMARTSAKSENPIRILEPLHVLIVCMVSIPIGQLCSQVWCRPDLAMNFGFFELRTFLWSPSEVELSR